MTEPGHDTELRVERSEGIATMCLDRPHARNALNHALRQAVVRTCRELDRDDDVEVIILTGTDPAFSAGVDLREAASWGTQRPYERTNPAQALRRMSTPVIAAVNGPCVTGGLELALSCTFIVASERASFADTHARVGLIAGWGLSALLPATVGLRRAREMSATGNFIDARTALEWGLANHVVAHENLEPFAHQLARDIASSDRPAVRAMLALYDAGAGVPAAHALGLEAEAVSGWATPRARSGALLDESIARGSAWRRRADGEQQ
jgi:enoyl-CoA hydratase